MGTPRFCRDRCRVVFKIMNKPGVSKGGQIVLVTDVDRIRPRAYLHRHNLHPMGNGFTAKGPNEVRMIVNKLEPMVRGKDVADGVKQIFDKVLGQLLRRRCYF